MDTLPVFIEVVLPLPVPGTFTYVVPGELTAELLPGKRVVVPFGRSRLYSAIVWKLNTVPCSGVVPRPVIAILDEEPLINEIQMKFWEWMSEYYMCHLGEVMNVAMPSGFKLTSETRVMIHEGFSGDITGLSIKEIDVIEALNYRKELSLTDIQELVDQAKVMPLVKTLIDKSIITVIEELKGKYHEKKEKLISLTKEYQEEDKLAGLMDILEKRAFKQLQLLLSYIQLNPKEIRPVVKKVLLEKSGTAAAQLKALVDKGVFEETEVSVSRLEKFDASHEAGSIILSERQDTVFEEIKTSFEGHNITLLHGVTSSGKTEIYIKLIEETLEQGKQVLYLLPEIALTAQIVNRLRKYFGERVGIYHSRNSENERIETWNAVISKPNDDKRISFSVMLGARSSLMLPYYNLGLIIIDEEHDYSFKQFDPAPRYNARDAAIYLAQLHGAKVILGSATPSMESFYNARSGKYSLSQLMKRYGDVLMPEVLIADVKKEARRRKMHSHFSSFLLDHVKTALELKEQVIMFQNRRGFSLRIECDVCNWMPQCRNCDVTLIYHKKFNHLRCHYCGYNINIPSTCPSCSSNDLKMKGFGTEKVEEELAQFFPDARIARMDLDTTRSKSAYIDIIRDFENRKIDILVGTQMVTKGLDFDNVSLVGILNADNMLSYPDFRAFERSYQLMSQVSGRSGRKQKRGKVIIQTSSPYHAIIRQVIDHDYVSMYEDQLLERRKFRYPPFVRLVLIKVKHRDARVLNAGSMELAKILRHHLEEEVLGPEYPVVSRIRNQYIKHIMIKLQKNTAAAGVKKNIMDLIAGFKKSEKSKGLKIQLDVDPV